MKKSNYIASAGIIATLYVVLTAVSNLFGLSSGIIQLRISEALCILPVFMPEAVAGLFIGCFISNILTGAVIYDVIFGSLATLIGAYLTRKLKNHRYLAFAPPILLNTAVIPLVLCYAYGFWQVSYFAILTVGLGEILSCGVMGFCLLKLLEKYKVFPK